MKREMFPRPHIKEDAYCFYNPVQSNNNSTVGTALKNNNK